MKYYSENVFLPKNSTIVEGSFQVQVGTDFIDGNGQFSEPLTSSQLLDQYGITVTSKNSEINTSSYTLEFTDFEIEIGLDGVYAFKYFIPA